MDKQNTSSSNAASTIRSIMSLESHKNKDSSSSSAVKPKYDSITNRLTIVNLHLSYLLYRCICIAVVSLEIVTRRLLSVVTATQSAKDSDTEKRVSSDASLAEMIVNEDNILSEAMISRSINKRESPPTELVVRYYNRLFGGDGTMSTGGGSGSNEQMKNHHISDPARFNAYLIKKIHSLNIVDFWSKMQSMILDLVNEYDSVTIIDTIYSYIMGCSVPISFKNQVFNTYIFTL